MTNRIVRFAKFGGPEVLSINDEPLKSPGKGDVRIKVKAIGLNQAEVMLREGRYVGKPDDEIEWGYHQFDDPEQRLLLGNTYLVETIEIVSSYPRISLIGVKGHFHISFFEKATGCIRQAQPLQ